MPLESSFATGSGVSSAVSGPAGVTGVPGSEPRPPRSRRWLWILVALPLASPLGAFAASSNGPAAKPVADSPGATNALSTNTPTIPQSILTIPKTRKEGVDPFFPLSIRVAAAETVNPTNRVAVMGELVIQGFSGRPEAPLVIINNHTFGIGEDGDVNTPQGRMRVRCVDIQLKTESAIVEVNKERRELRFRSGTVTDGVRRTDR